MCIVCFIVVYVFQVKLGVLKYKWIIKNKIKKRTRVWLLNIVFTRDFTLHRRNHEMWWAQICAYKFWAKCIKWRDLPVFLFFFLKCFWLFKACLEGGIVTIVHRQLLHTCACAPMFWFGTITLSKSHKLSRRGSSISCSCKKKSAPVEKWKVGQCLPVAPSLRPSSRYQTCVRL